MALKTLHLAIVLNSETEIDGDYLLEIYNAMLATLPEQLGSLTTRFDLQDPTEEERDTWEACETLPKPPPYSEESITP